MYIGIFLKNFRVLKLIVTKLYILATFCIVNFLYNFIDRGSYKDIAEYFVEGATLPKNLTKEAAIEKIGNELKEIFLGGLANVMTDHTSSQSYLNNVKAHQEKANLRQMTKEEARKYKKNPNLLAPNSEDYLVYKLKQDMKLPPQPPFWEDKIKTDIPPLSNKVRRSWFVLAIW